MLMIVLLSGCCNGLHSMTDICGDYRKQFDIRFNPLESQTACFGGNPPSHFPLVLNGMTIPITKKLNTLVCILTVKPIPRTQPWPSENFFGSSNNIMSVLVTARDEMLAVHLVKTYCLPVLLYGSETWSLSSSDKYKLMLLGVITSAKFLMDSGEKA